MEYCLAEHTYYIGEGETFYWWDWPEDELSSAVAPTDSNPYATFTQNAQHDTLYEITNEQGGVDGFSIVIPYTATYPVEGGGTELIPFGGLIVTVLIVVVIVFAAGAIISRSNGGRF